MLEATEYLQLAIHAAQSGDHHAALGYLNQGLELEPENAALIYFQAAEYAEMGLFDRARAGMVRALEINGSIDIARFQLGLLYLKLEQPDAALEAFKVLVRNAADSSLRIFGEAYVDILSNELDAARVKLQAGLLECNNPALRKDMARILNELEGKPATNDDETGDESAAVFLGAYRNTLETP